MITKKKFKRLIKKTGKYLQLIADTAFYELKDAAKKNKSNFELDRMKYYLDGVEENLNEIFYILDPDPFKDSDFDDDDDFDNSYDY